MAKTQARMEAEVSTSREALITLSEKHERTETELAAARQDLRSAFDLANAEKAAASMANAACETLQSRILHHGAAMSESLQNQRYEDHAREMRNDQEEVKNSMLNLEATCTELQQQLALRDAEIAKLRAQFHVGDVSGCGYSPSSWMSCQTAS